MANERRGGLGLRKAALVFSRSVFFGVLALLCRLRHMLHDIVKCLLSRISSCHNSRTVPSEHRSRFKRQHNAHVACSRAEVPLGGVPESPHDGTVGNHVTARYPRCLPNDQKFIFSCNGCALGQDFLHIPKLAVAGTLHRAVA